MKTAAVENFWKKFCGISDESFEKPYQVWYFGNSSEMALELVELVMAGRKTATASLVEFNEKYPELAPLVDGYSVVTDFEGTPRCVIRTTEIQRVPFDDVDAEFAFNEGEGDRSLAYWRDVHWRYFTKEAAENNLDFNGKSLVCCERFKLLFLG